MPHTSDANIEPHDVHPKVHPEVRRPNARFLLSHPAHFIALGFGSGLSPVAPGTAGTLWAWLAYLVMQHWLPQPWIVGIVILSLPVGWWASTITATHMRRLDPGNIVWDEVAAFWIVMLVISPVGFMGQLIAFVLFRFFDAAKPGPVGWADRSFKGFGAKGGFGIMFDDLVAAGCTLMVIAIAHFANLTRFV